MTIIIDSTCENITIESDYLSPTNLSVTLSVTINCGTEYVIQANPSDSDIVIDPATLNLDLLALEDGVYYFVLTIIQADSTEVIETKCAVVNCSMACQMLDSFVAASGGDEEAAIRSLSYYALVTAEQCTSCACADLCTLYNGTQLNNCETNVTTCGCS